MPREGREPLRKDYHAHKTRVARQQDMTSRIMRPWEEFVDKHTWDNKDIFFTSNALGGELGEVQNVIKKEVAFQDFPNYADKVRQREELGEPGFRDMFVDEMGDVLFYYTQLLNKKGVTFEEVMNMQIRKIQKQSDDHGQPYKK